MKKMKTINLFSVFLIMALFMSCSTDEMIDSNKGSNNTPEIHPEQLNFKFFDLKLSSESGKASGSDTRSADDVDELGRPKGAYPLNDIFLVKEQQDSEGNTNIESKKMSVKGSSKIAYAFVDNLGKSDESDPTYVHITPAATKDDPNSGVTIKLSTLKKEISKEMDLEDIEKGDIFFYRSTTEKNVSLTKTYDNFCNELGDILFSSAYYYLVFDKKEKNLVAFKIDKVYQMAFPANDPGTEAGGLWPINVNRLGAALSIRYMVTGDYYNNNKGNNEAVAEAFEKVTGFHMNELYSEQAYVGNFPSVYDVENESIVPPNGASKRCNLLIYDVDKKVTTMKEIEFMYSNNTQSITGMGLATTEIPFVYPMQFSTANSFNITIGVQSSEGDVKMNFSIHTVDGQYSLTSNTNTIFYLKMTATELGEFYKKALNKKTRSNSIATFELPSSALKVVKNPVSAK